jgi:hypothetical protein
MRRVVLFSVLSLVAACHEPSQRPATMRSPSSVVVAPVVSREGSRERMTERVPGVEWTTRPERLGLPKCDDPFPVPVVSQPQPLATSVAAWIGQELADRRSLLSDAAGCQLSEIKVPVDVRRVHGLVTVSFWAPEPIDTKFFFPVQKTFALRTGKPFSHVVAEAKRDVLLTRLTPRYRTTMQQWLREHDLSPDCGAVLDQYSPSLDDFGITERGFSFSGWASLPMWARACYPQNEPVLTAEELEPFLDPEVLAAWREE